MLAHRLGQFDLTEPIRRSFQPIEPVFATILRTMVRRAWTLSPCQRRRSDWSPWRHDIDCLQIRCSFFFNLFCKANTLFLQLGFCIFRSTLLHGFRYRFRGSISCRLSGSGQFRLSLSNSTRGFDYRLFGYIF